jgi:hypothetical protein
VVDVSVQTVAMLLGMMLGIVALVGLFHLTRLLGRIASDYRARARGEVGPGAWVEEPAPPNDQAEQICLERWQALLGGPVPWAHGAGPGALRGTSGGRSRNRRLLIGVLMVAALPAGYLSWTMLKPPPRELDDPEEILELVSIEKWADAVSMFEDKLRLRFEYRNRSSRRVDAFAVYLRLEEKPGRVVLQDLISVSNPVGSGQTSSWTETYWATCKQVRSPESWAGLLQKDLNAYTIEWRPIGLVYEDGEGRTVVGTMQDDSMPEKGR